VRAARPLSGRRGEAGLCMSSGFAAHAAFSFTTIN